MRALILCFIIGLLGFSILAAAEPDGPGAAAAAFYTELISRKVTGLPQGEAWTALAPRMTEGLVEAIRAAQKEQADFIKREPNEKPPWIEGDLFSSTFEGPQQFTVGKPLVSKDGAVVPVDFTYTDRGQTSKWTDKLQLKKKGKTWLIDDVIYGGEWAFGNKGTLQEALAPEPSHISPDGRFEFVVYTLEESNAGKPPFGIVERRTGDRVWQPVDDLGDASRPEEWVLWAPDSKRFALVTRVSTRRLGTFFFGWDGKTFSRLPWKDAGQLETQADAEVAANARGQGFTQKAEIGQVLSDDTLPVRWVGADSVLMVRSMERRVHEADKEDSTASASARTVLRWSARAGSFSMVPE